MDDPWAAGPSWTPSKPPTAADNNANDGPSRSPTFTPPPASFDVSDPWGVPSGAKLLPGEESRPKSPARTPAEAEEAGWGAGPDADAGAGDGGWEGRVIPPEPPEDGVAGDVDVRHDEQLDGHDEGWGGGEDDIMVAQESESDKAEDTGEDAREIVTLDSPEATGKSGQVDLASPPRSPLALPVEIPSDVSSFPTFHAPSHDTSTFDASTFGAPTFDAPPQQPFASDIPDVTLPKSPSFGDDAFGGFSTGFASSDPWGTTAEVGGGWGGAGEEVDLPRFGSGDLRVNDEGDESDQEGEGEGWGRVRPPVPMSREGSMARDDKEEDWEEVQRKIRLQEERMPRAKVEGLKDRWKELVLGLVVENLEALTEEEERNLSDVVRKVEGDSYEALRSLSLIPPDINIYPPVISSLVTHERHVYALSRPNPTPSTSLLTLALARKPRRIHALDSDSPWLTRSKLGEPEAPPVDAPALSPEVSGSKWSFWRKPTLERQLTTSGGGVLEVKSPTAPTISRTSSDIKMGFGSKPASIMTNTSRPASPAPSLPVSFSENDFGHTAPGGLIDSTSIASIPSVAPTSATQATSPPTSATPAPGPSAMSRFFGRLGRNKTPVPTDGKVDNRDLELSADDFTFLSEVPSLSDPADHDVGDLLNMEPGRGEQMASLESMLSSKPAPLPAPLAPPPRSGPISRTASGSGAGFVPRMKAPVARPPSDMDLLGGLEFADVPSPTSTSTPPPPPIQKSPPSGTTQLGGSMWDDFLAPAPAVPAGSAPQAGMPAVMDLGSPATLMGPPRPSSSQPVQEITSTPSAIFALSPPRAPAPIATAPASSISLAPPASDDFDDFGTPQKGSVARFDDFDFGSFETPASKRQPAAAAAASFDAESDTLKTPQNASASQFDSFDLSPFEERPARPTIVTPAPKIQTHQPRSSLDHTPTISLMASATKGKRWPAPPSPIAPVLDPPPKSSPASSGAGFPFLSPPPPPGRATPSRGMDLLGEQSATNASTDTAIAAPAAGSVPSPQFHIQPVQQKPLHGLMPTPPRASSPLVPASTGMRKDAASGSQGGLSSADLSFFDSL